MIAKCLNKLFALDARSSAVEYGIITVLVAAAVVAALLAVSDSLTGAYVALVGAPPAPVR
jgi:Flp pilus assembly pilin Flp